MKTLLLIQLINLVIHVAAQINVFVHAVGHLIK